MGDGRVGAGRGGRRGGERCVDGLPVRPGSGEGCGGGWERGWERGWWGGRWRILLPRSAAVRHRPPLSSLSAAHALKGHQRDGRRRRRAVAGVRRRIPHVQLGRLRRDHEPAGQGVLCFDLPVQGRRPEERHDKVLAGARLPQVEHAAVRVIDGCASRGGGGGGRAAGAEGPLRPLPSVPSPSRGKKATQRARGARCRRSRAASSSPTSARSPSALTVRSGRERETWRRARDLCLMRRRSAPPARRPLSLHPATNPLPSHTLSPFAPPTNQKRLADHRRGLRLLSLPEMGLRRLHRRRRL